MAESMIASLPERLLLVVQALSSTGHSAVTVIMARYTAPVIVLVPPAKNHFINQPNVIRQVAVGSSSMLPDKRDIDNGNNKK